MSKPFYLKGGVKRIRPSSLGSDSDENAVVRQGTHAYELELESISDSDGSSIKNMEELDPCSPNSSTPGSLSPLSSLSSGDSQFTNRTFEFPSEPLNFLRYANLHSSGMQPSTSLLEVSIANLPPESELKQSLLKIREQMAVSLVRLKELEEQVRNVPTLQVRISVLQEEKRQLIKQLQSKGNRKRSRSVGPSLGTEYSVYNNMHSKGSKSDTENDGDDDYALIRKKLRVRLNSVGVGDYLVNGPCSCCPTVTPAVFKTPVKSVCVGTDTQLDENSLQPARGVKELVKPVVQTRSIGVGMMRSFTRDVGVGEDKPIIYTESKGSQASVGMVDSACDALSATPTRDMAVLVKPDVSSKGIGTIMEENSTDSSLYKGTEIHSSKLMVHTGVQTSRGPNMSLVSIGVGICTIDDELSCRKCSNRKSRAVVKTVDEIMANRIDIPFYRSVGVGDSSLNDNYLCNRCSNIETRTIAVGEKIECRNVAIGDFSVSEDSHCGYCSNLKTRNIGCSTDCVVTVDTGSGEDKIDDFLFCDHCSNLQTASIGSGNFKLEEGSVCELCNSEIQAKAESIVESLVSSDVVVTTESTIEGSHLVAEKNDVETCVSTENISSVKRSTCTHTIGVGSCGIMDSFCDRCDNLHTRSIGVGSGNISVDVICDRCSNKKTKSVGTSSDIIETRTLGVSECCITDNYCDRCMNIRTQTVAIGDCCVTDSFCERCFNVQMQSIGVGDFDVNTEDSTPVIQANLISVDNNNMVDINKNMKTNSSVTTKNVRHIQSKQSSPLMYSNDGIKKVFRNSKESNLHESDESIDNDNPSSDTASQTSEVLETTPSPERIRITDEVVVACKLLNGHLYKGKEIGREQMISCMSTVENNWFRCVSSRDSDPEVIKGLLRIFKNQIHMLLETILNLVDGNGNNALHYAVSFRNWKLVDVLLDTGLMNLNLPNKAGYTPIMMAALAGVVKEDDKGIARKLFKTGDINKQVEETGQSPLMLAVSRGRMEMVELTLEAGADINATDEDGSTALMCACEHGHLNIAKRLLLEPHCDASLEDNEGSTALSIAMQRNFKDLALLVYGNVSFDPIGKPRKKIGGLPCKAS